MNGLRPKEDEEKLDLTDKILAKNRKIRQYKLSYCMVVIFIYIGYRFFGIIGALVCGGLGVLANMINGSFQGLRFWREYARDWTQRVSHGLSPREALKIISKSFYKDLPETFHEKVAEKLPSLDQVVVFYAGALPENVPDEEHAQQFLERTIIQRQPPGTHTARTKW